MLQTFQPIIQFFVHAWLIIPQLRIKVLSIWGSRHSSGEDGFDNERVVLLERFTITFAERDGKLFAGRIDVPAEGLCGEVESSVQKLEKKNLVSSAVAAPFWPTVSLSVLQMDSRTHSPVQPQETFSRGVFLRLELVSHKIL